MLDATCSIIAIGSEILHLLVRHKHHLFAINILITTIQHPHLARRQLSTARLQRLDLRGRNPAHVLLEVLIARHDGLALNIAIGMHGPRRFAVHLACDKGEFVGPCEEHIEGGFELEDRLEDCAAAEDVQTQAGAGECDSQAADIAKVADRFCADEGEDDV